MWESANTTFSNGMHGFNSQLSFYEYPTHKPFINTVHQPLRPSHTLSNTAAIPESNRDHLLTALQSLSIRIKKLEGERERAESSLREITDGIPRNRSREFDAVSQRQDTAYSSSTYPFDSDPIERTRSTRKKKRNSQRSAQNESDPDGRHYHLDMNTVPFILGGSTAPSHNVKSNVQNVIALLKKHNHQLCLTSKEYAELLNPSNKSDLSANTLLYLDHYNKAPRRCSSASPMRRPSVRARTASFSRRSSLIVRPHTATFSNQQCYSRMKSLQQEFSKLAREHKRLNASRANVRELGIINERMKIILQELEEIQRQLKISTRDPKSNDFHAIDRAETALDTLKKTRLIQILLNDGNQTDQQRKRRAHRRF